MNGLAWWLLGVAVGIGIGSTALIPETWVLVIQIVALVTGIGISVINIYGMVRR